MLRMNAKQFCRSLANIRPIKDTSSPTLAQTKSNNTYNPNFIGSNKKSLLKDLMIKELGKAANEAVLIY